jgi:hypothetical protein
VAAATPVLRSNVILSARITWPFCQASTWPVAVTRALSLSYSTLSALKVTGSFLLNGGPEGCRLVSVLVWAGAVSVAIQSSMRHARVVRKAVLPRAAGLEKATAGISSSPERCRRSILSRLPPGHPDRTIDALRTFRAAGSCCRSALIEGRGLGEGANVAKLATFLSLQSASLLSVKEVLIARRHSERCGNHNADNHQIRAGAGSTGFLDPSLDAHPAPPLGDKLDTGCHKGGADGGCGRCSRK